ncbi:HAMP domain-containing sensor histidine kinase [Ramlibacter sp. H39-3-26]|uniref:ATP-binding protein n=1 Tax=Curvibacter soli TaxID=3031331 RepID=UPI0023DBC33D|nr:HAMP domain-containing sensor histidine kinase [Ramlibacter sp. H39-3-26]MDF1484769.1 HAMP domain-containing sensor histidine kinase [Ramlibacter sp. H39-3-26]
MEQAASDIRAPTGTSQAFVRLWHGVLTARIMVAVAVLLLQLLTGALGQVISPVFAALCVAYLGLTVTARLLAGPAVPAPHPSAHWLATIGVDIATFAALQWLQTGTMNYTPLFGIPILIASVLGSLTLALGTTACVTLLLLADAGWLAAHLPGDAAPRFLQAALTGTGYFVVAALVQQLAVRLAREEELSRHSRIANAIQLQVNALVLEHLTDGVLVIDAQGSVQAANPAGLQLLASGRYLATPPFALAGMDAWRPLLELAQATFRSGEPQTADVTMQHTGQSLRRLHLRTRLTVPQAAETPSVCVMFAHDLREMEAKLRTEKLAAMGRMSAAVAHEIRNPLAAIVQANALLDEELHEAAQKRLTLMVQQNAERLARIVEEVLDIARAQHPALPASLLPLDDAVAQICRDWQSQAPLIRQPALSLQAGAARVEFDADHLRRILVNLLDNAQRYANGHADSLQVSTRASPQGGAARLEVWSDGAPLEKTVESHLFEPFFSSESRSSGLGLFICRELCERHGASMGYQRITHDTARGPLGGNAFTVVFRHGNRTAPRSPFDTIVV